MNGDRDVRASNDGRVDGTTVVRSWPSGPPPFDDARLPEELDAASFAEFDRLPFGLIAMDRRGIVVAYNANEAARSGLRPERVVGRDMFVDVAPCVNNYLVAERYRGAEELDEELDYVFTFRMRPTPVRLRLMAVAGSERQYLAVRDRFGGQKTVSCPERELEDLLQYFYQCPVGLIEIGDRGRVRRINPAAARMLAPGLVGGEDLTELHGLLARLCPDLFDAITAQPSRLGPIDAGRRRVVDLGDGEAGQIELRAVRVDRGRVMVVCADASAEQRLARRTLALATRLRDVVAATTAYRGAAAEALEISTSAVMALEELVTRGPRTPGAISRRLGLTPATLTSTIDQLERAGYVARTRNPADRRSVVITLAPAARERIGPVLELLTGGVDRVAEGAAAAHDHDIAAVLDAVTAALRSRAAVQTGRPDPTPAGDPAES